MEAINFLDYWRSIFGLSSDLSHITLGEGPSAVAVVVSETLDQACSVKDSRFDTWIG